MAASSIVQERARVDNGSAPDPEAELRQEIENGRRYERAQWWRNSIRDGVIASTSDVLRDFFRVESEPFGEGVAVRDGIGVAALLDATEVILRDYRDGIEAGTPEGTEYLRDALGYLAAAAAADLRRRDLAVYEREWMGTTGASMGAPNA